MWARSVGLRAQRLSNGSPFHRGPLGMIRPSLSITYVPVAYYNDDNQGMGGKVKTKFIDPGSSYEAMAASCATRGDYEKIETLLEEVKKPTIKIYNCLIRAYIKAQMFGKIGLVMEKLKDTEQPNPDTDTFMPLILEYTKWGLKSHAMNVLFLAAEHSALNYTCLKRIIDIYMNRGDTEEIMFFTRCFESADIFEEEHYDSLFEYISSKGANGYDLLKKYLVVYREMVHAPIRLRYYEFLLFSSVYSPKTTDCFHIWEYLMDTYPHFHPDGSNHVCRHLLHKAAEGELLSDKIRRVFYRGVARGSRFSNDIANEVLLHFYKQEDHQNVFTTFQIMTRDCYALFAESHVPIIKTALALNTEESLSVVPKVLMESLIPEDYRVGLLQNMVDMHTSTSNSCDFSGPIQSVFEYVKENTVFSMKLNFVLLDYFLARNDVQQAKELIILTLKRYHTEKLKNASSTPSGIEIPEQLSESIEMITKSRYSTSETGQQDVSIEFQTNDALPKEKAYDDLLREDFLKKFENIKETTSFLNTSFLHRNKSANSDKATQNALKQLNSPKMPNSFYHFSKAKTDASKPYFSRNIADGELFRIQNDLMAKPKPSAGEQRDWEQQKDGILFPTKNSVFSEPRESIGLSQNFQHASRVSDIKTGLEGAMERLPEKPTKRSIVSTSFQELFDRMPHHTIQEELIDERFQRNDPLFDPESSEEFEYNNVNEIQARSQIPEDDNTIMDDMWTNVLTYQVANHGEEEALNFVSDLLCEVTYASAPSVKVCKRFNFPPSWRSQLE